MAKQTIDTDKVTISQTRLRTANQNINDAYDPLQHKIKQLETYWKGKAGTAAHTVVFDLNNMSKARSLVLDNYVKTLERLVVPGYSKAETTNTKLADEFK